MINGEVTHGIRECEIPVSDGEGLGGKTTETRGEGSWDTSQPSCVPASQFNGCEAWGEQPGLPYSSVILLKSGNHNSEPRVELFDLK